MADYSEPTQQPLAAHRLAKQETLHERLEQQAPHAKIPPLWEMLKQLL